MVLDVNALPSHANFPTGTFKWHYDDYKYDWSGSSDATASAVNVGYTYKWGNSAEATGTYAIRSTNYKVDEINGFNMDGETIKSLGFDALTLTEKQSKLVEYINSITSINGFYADGTTISGLEVKWDLTNLQNAVKGITEKGVVNYYKGIDVKVTAYVGGKTFRPIRQDILDNTGKVDYSYGFIGNGSTNPEYADPGYVAQAIEVPVRVAGYTVEKVSSEIRFDPYSASELNGSTLGTSFTFRVNDNGVKRDVSLNVGNTLSVNAPFVYVGDNDYRDAVSFGFTQDDITYLGYKGRQLYAELSVGTDYCGKQILYVPINVIAKSAATVEIAVAHEDTFNPEWYATEEYEVLEDVSFGGTGRHDMVPDWSTIKYYSSSSCAANTLIENIYEGGIIYAQVAARVYKTENGQQVEVGSVVSKDGQGNRILIPQTITLRLTVEEQIINNDIGFYYNPEFSNLDIYRIMAELQAKAEQGDADAIRELAQIESERRDLANYKGKVYGQTHLDGETAYGLNPYNFATHRDQYFKIGKWGDVLNGTAVLITPNVGTPYIAYVQRWSDVESEKPSSIKDNINGISSRSVIGYIGNQRISVNIRVPNYNFKSVEFAQEEQTAVRYIEGTPSAPQGMTFEYSVLNAWALPQSGTFRSFEGVRPIDTAINWLDTTSPSVDELKVDEASGKSYVERKYRFFEGTTIQSAEFTARIYVTDFDLDVSSIAINGLTLDSEGNALYTPFAPFAYPTTATVVHRGNTYSSVPVLWNNYDMPSAEEIAAGKFVRKAYVGGDMNAADWAQDITFKVTSGYEFIAPFTNEGALAIHIDKANFYNGLPRVGKVVVDGKQVDVNFEWSDDYDNTGYNGNMVVKVFNDNLTIYRTVKVTVDATNIEEVVVNGGEFRLDPYGKEDTLFASGNYADVKLDGVDTVVKVRGEYTLPDDFYFNSTKYFGTYVDLDVTFYYNSGKSVMTETVTLRVYVIDRTALYINNYRYRSIVVDPFLHDSFDYLPDTLDITTFPDADITSFDVSIEWPDNSLIANRTDDTGYMALLTYVFENANGNYVYEDLTGNGAEYVLYKDYLEKVGSDAANVKRYTLSHQSINVPITILNRNIVKSAFDFDGRYELKYTDRSRFSTTTESYVGDNGRFVEIVYDNTSNLPTGIVYHNQFAYGGASAMPTKMRFDFENGDSKVYDVTFSNIIGFNELTSNTSNNRVIKMHVWSQDSQSGERFEVITRDIEVTVRAAEISLTNSDAGLVDMQAGAYKYNFDVYTAKSDAIFNSGKFSDKITYYVGGQFVKLSDYNGADVGIDDDPNAVRENKLNSVYTIYKNADGMVKYRQNGRNYVADPDGEYVFVYVTTQTLDAAWDHSGVSYTYRGGNVTTSVSVHSNIPSNICTTTLNVTVRINDSRVTGSDIEFKTADADESKYLNPDKTFTIDPNDTTNEFERKPIPGAEDEFVALDQRYAVLSDGATYRANVNGTYKKVGDDYVQMTYEELGIYRYFPSQMTFNINGKQTVVNITWDLGGVAVTYAGGEFTAYALINARGEYNFLKNDTVKVDDNSNLNDVGVQRIAFKVTVTDRSAQGGYVIMDNEWIGNAGNNNVGYMKNDGTVPSGKYIDPYSYVKPTMPDSVKIKLADGTEQTFSVNDANYNLQWSYGSFRPSYEGGIVNVVAMLTAPDGNVQRINVPFLVYKKTAKKIESSGFTATVENGQAKATFTVDPYNSSTLSLPTSYKVTFDVAKPVYNTTTGTVGKDDFVQVTTGVDTERTFKYTIVTMPSGMSYKIENGVLKSTIANGRVATIQLSAQQIISVPISVTEHSVADANNANETEKNSGSTVTTRSNGVPIVWYGTATVTGKGNNRVSTYNVMISANADTTTLPSVKGRTIVYKLKPAIGLVVDKNGTVITTKVVDGVTVPDAQREGVEITITV